MHSPVFVTHHSPAYAHTQTHTLTIQNLSTLLVQAMAFHTTLPLHVLPVLPRMLPTTCLCSTKPQLKFHLFYDTSLMPLETLNPETETVTQFPLQAPTTQHFVQISITGPSKASVP